MRIGYSEDEDYPGQFELWQANCRRSLQGKAGQAALRELEAALLAMPEKRLIANKMIDADGDVCAIGALAKHKGRDLIAETKAQLADIGIDRFDDDEIDGDGEMEEIGMELGMPRLVAWKVVCKNDVEIDGHYETLPGPARWHGDRPQMYVPVTPEVRYQKMLAWVQRQILSNETQHGQASKTKSS
jgi:hypothetical protein